MKETAWIISLILITQSSLNAEVNSYSGVAIPFEGRAGAHIAQFDDALEDLIDPNATVYLLADGFELSEGPLWVDREGGFLLNTDIPGNRIYRYREGVGIDVFLTPSGYGGPPRLGGGIGSNGLAFDLEGNLLLCQQGSHRVARYRWSGDYETVAATYRGKRFIRPNDLTVSSAGVIYFTNPARGFSLPHPDSDLAKSFFHGGVFKVDPDNTVTLVDEEMLRPNGIGLSPDEKTLYVTRSVREAPAVYAYDINPDGTLSNKRLFHDFSHLAILSNFRADGMAVDVRGNLWVTGPFGVWILSPEGKALGTIVTRKHAANCTFGGSDRSVLYITADSYLLRVQTRTRGK